MQPQAHHNLPAAQDAAIALARASYNSDIPMVPTDQLAAACPDLESVIAFLKSETLDPTKMSYDTVYREFTLNELYTLRLQEKYGRSATWYNKSVMWKALGRTIEEATLHMLPHAQQKADYFCAMSDPNGVKYRAYDERRPVDPTRTVTCHDPKDRSDDAEPVELKIRDYEAKPVEYGVIRHAIKTAEGEAHKRRLVDYLEKRNEVTDQLQYGDTVYLPDIIGAPARMGKTMAWFATAWFDFRMGFVCTFGCAPNKKDVVKAVWKKMINLGWAHQGVVIKDPRKTLTDSDIKAKEQAVINTDKDTNLLICSIDEAGDVRVRRSFMEQRPGAVFSHYYDEAQVLARWGAEQAEKEVEVARLRVLKAQHENKPDEQIRRLEVMVERKKVKLEKMQDGITENLRPTLVNSKGFQTLISATLLPSLQEPQLWGTQTDYPPLGINPDNTIFWQQGYPLPPIAPLSSGTYVGINETDINKYDDALTRERVYEVYKKLIDARNRRLAAAADADGNSQIRDLQSAVDAKTGVRDGALKSFNDMQAMLPANLDDAVRNQVLQHMQKAVDDAEEDLEMAKMQLAESLCVPLQIEDRIFDTPGFTNMSLLYLNGTKSNASARRQLAETAKALAAIRWSIVGTNCQLERHIHGDDQKPDLMPMNIICPTQMMGKSKTGSCADWMAYTAKMCIQANQPACVAVWTSVIKEHHLIASFQAVGLDPPEFDEKYSKSKGSVTYFTVMPRIGGRCKMMPVHERVATCDDMIKKDIACRPLPMVKRMAIFLYGYDMFAGALTLSVQTSWGNGDERRPVIFVPQRTIMATTGQRALDAVYQMVGRSMNDFAFETDLRLSLQAHKDTHPNLLAYAAAETNYMKSMNVPAGKERVEMYVSGDQLNIEPELNVQRRTALHVIVAHVRKILEDEHGGWVGLGRTLAKRLLGRKKQSLADTMQDFDPAAVLAEIMAHEGLYEVDEDEDVDSSVDDSDPDRARGVFGYGRDGFLAEVERRFEAIKEDAILNCPNKKMGKWDRGGAFEKSFNVSSVRTYVNNIRKALLPAHGAPVVSFPDKMPSSQGRIDDPYVAQQLDAMGSHNNASAAFTTFIWQLFASEIARGLTWARMFPRAGTAAVAKRVREQGAEDLEMEESDDELELPAKRVNAGPLEGPRRERAESSMEEVEDGEIAA